MTWIYVFFGTVLAFILFFIGKIISWGQNPAWLIIIAIIWALIPIIAHIYINRHYKNLKQKAIDRFEKAHAKSFYLECKKRKIKTVDDIKNYYDYVKVIAANYSLVFENQSDAISAFQKGYDIWKEEETAKKKAAAEKAIAEKQALRAKDEKERYEVEGNAKYYLWEDKYLIKIRAEIASLNKTISDAEGSFGVVSKLATTPIDNGHRPDAAIMGGIAAGITGSSVIGASVAYQTEQSNKQRDSVTYLSKEESFRLMDAAVDRQTKAEQKLGPLIKKRDSFLKKGILYDGLNPEQKIKMLTFSDWNYTVRESDNIDVTAKITLNQDVKMFDSTGFLDGSLIITCYNKNHTKIGTGYYCAPGFGDTTLKKSGFGKTKGDQLDLTALVIIDETEHIKKGDKLEFGVEPYHLWITEIK